MYINLRELNKLKVNAFNEGRKGNMIEVLNLPRNLNYGHYSEICVANILGHLHTEIIVYAHFYVSMTPELDRYGVDLR